MTPDYDAGTVTVKAHVSQPGGAKNLWAVVRAGGVTIAEDWGSDEADRDGEVTLHIPEEQFRPWSPDRPFLYDLTVGTTQGQEEDFDTVQSSHFALRKWETKPDARGVLRVFPQRQAHFAERPAGPGLTGPRGCTPRPAARRWCTSWNR